MPIVGSITKIGAPKYQEQENRELEKAPNFPKSYEEWLRFPKKFERFYSDNFGFREPLLAIANSLKYSAGVALSIYSVAGKDGWSFHNQNVNSKMADRYSPMNYDEQADFKLAMSQIRSDLNEKGIVFLHIAVPEKDSIYPEYLPPRLTFSDSNRLDQLNDLLSDDFSYINAKTPLLDAKRLEPNKALYYKIDFHWNCWGAYIVYRKAIDRLVTSGLNVPLVQPSEIKFKDVSAETSAHLSHIDAWLSPMQKKDTSYECSMNKNPLIEMHLRQTGEDMPNINGEIEKPEIGLSRKTALYDDWLSTNTSGSESLKAMVIRDSFSSYLTSYFVRSFSETLFIHKSTLIPGRLVRPLARFKPDVVVYQYSERSLENPTQLISEKLVIALEAQD